MPKHKQQYYSVGLADKRRAKRKLLPAVATHNYPGKRIPLSQGKFAVVDKADYEHMMQYKWSCVGKPPLVYAHTRTTKFGSVLYMHRVIMNAPKGMQVDHIDGDCLNNRRGNLRVCTQSQNSHNSRLSVRNTSGYKGVRFSKQRKKWMVFITVNGTVTNFGYFPDVRTAVKKYNELALKYYGDFATLNPL